jgi:hypothetical protein
MQYDENPNEYVRDGNYCEIVEPPRTQNLPPEPRTANPEPRTEPEHEPSTENREA